jgi:hypothetical protein
MAFFRPKENYFTVVERSRNAELKIGGAKIEAEIEN